MSLGIDRLSFILLHHDRQSLLGDWIGKQYNDLLCYLLFKTLVYYVSIQNILQKVF